MSVHMELEPVPDLPALRAGGAEGWIVVADLHVGIEVQLRRSGFNLPSQTPKMADLLESLSEMAKNLIILGDLKHKIPSVGRREDIDIKELMGRMLASYSKVVLVAGNHDGGISSALPEGCKALRGQGTVIEDVGLFHGHVWPSDEVMAARKVVTAHIHPAILMVDSLGTRSSEKCWVRAKFDGGKVKERYGSCPRQLVVMPAFNPLITGTPVNADKVPVMGPLFKNRFVDPDSLRVHLLDGTYISTPASLSRPKPR